MEFRNANLVKGECDCPNLAIEMWSFCWEAELLMAVPHTIRLSLQRVFLNSPAFTWNCELRSEPTVWRTRRQSALYLFGSTWQLFYLQLNNEEIWVLNRRCWLILFSLFLWEFIWCFLIRIFVFRRQMPRKVFDIFPQILWRVLCLFPCRRFVACKRSLMAWIETPRWQNYWTTFLAYSSTFRC